MSPRPVNIQIVGTALPGFLTSLRERRQLTKSELASLAKVSYRTVHELESGRRERIQEKTLLLLAEALGAQPHELFGPVHESAGGSGPAPRLSRRRAPTANRRRIQVQPLLMASVLLLVAAAFGAAVWLAGIAGADWTVLDGGIVARHAVLGHDLWRYTGPGSVLHAELSPWSSRIVLARIKGADAAASPLLALDRRNGRVLWSAVPDLEELVRAFGHEIMEAGSMYPIDLVAADLYGDGDPVVVVNFRQAVYYPTCLCVVDRRGRRLAQYSSKGYIYEMLAVDLDGDGKDVLVAAGTNNDPAYQGATVVLLDDRHFLGATTDALAAPLSTVPDSARIRLVLPQFPEPYMRVMGMNRLNASRLQLLSHDAGRVGFSVDVGVGDHRRLIVFMDAQLRPLKAAPSDAFLGFMQRIFPDSLQGTGPADQQWVRQWLDSHVRFEAGHWPPSDLIAGATIAAE